MESWLRGQGNQLQLLGRPPRRAKRAETLDLLPAIRPQERQDLPTEKFSPVKNCRHGSPMHCRSGDGLGRCGPAGSYA